MSHTRFRFLCEPMSCVRLRFHAHVQSHNQGSEAVEGAFLGHLLHTVTFHGGFFGGVGEGGIKILGHLPCLVQVILSFLSFMLFLDKVC